MLLLYQIIITITCWHHLFQITSLFNQFTSLLALNCSCPNFFWNVLQVWMTGKDVYLQMTWSWPDKTWNILCSYCPQWNTSQSKFRNHYFLFLFAFSILSQLFSDLGLYFIIIINALNVRFPPQSPLKPVPVRPPIRDRSSVPRIPRWDDYEEISMPEKIPMKPLMVTEHLAVEKHLFS